MKQNIYIVATTAAVVLVGFAGKLSQKRMTRSGRRLNGNFHVLEDVVSGANCPVAW